MKRFLPIIFPVSALLLLGAVGNARPVIQTDSLKVSFYYEVARHEIDYNFVRHQKQVAELADTCRVDSVRIYGYVSPEGGAEFNRRLAQDRAEALANLVTRQWPGAEVLEVRGMGVDYAIEQKVANWPLMRRADAYVWYHPVAGGKASPEAGVRPGGACRCGEGCPCLNGGPCTGDDGCAGCRPCSCGRGAASVRDTVVLYYVPDNGKRKEPKPADQTPAWALKTNLLLLGVAAPNVEAEFPLGTRNRWSVEAELICPWWTFSHDAYAEQLLNVGVEFRYWLGRRQYHGCLDGWHVGLAGAFGYYDLEWKSEGFQGEHVNAYFNIGYQHRWGSRKQWGVDAGIGIGAIYTPRHRHYLGSTLYPENHTEPYDDHLMYRNKGTLLWPGASHVNVSLMYFFDIKRKEGGR